MQDCLPNSTSGDWRLWTRHSWIWSLLQLPSHRGMSQEALVHQASASLDIVIHSGDHVCPVVPCSLVTHYPCLVCPRYFLVLVRTRCCQVLHLVRPYGLVSPRQTCWNHHLSWHAIHSRLAKESHFQGQNELKWCLLLHSSLVRCGRQRVCWVDGIRSKFARQYST